MALNADLRHEGLNARRPVVSQSARDASHLESSQSPRQPRRVPLMHSGGSVEPIAPRRGLMTEERRRRLPLRPGRDRSARHSRLPRNRHRHSPPLHRPQPRLDLVAIDRPALLRVHVPALRAAAAHKGARR